MQRVRVGMTGLAAVLLLIGLAGAVFSAVDRNGAATSTVEGNTVANLAFGNSRDAESEPLAELGVAPSAVSGNQAQAQQAPR